MCFQDEEEAGLLEQVKSQICDNVALYAQKYDEEFSPHLPSFVTAVWNLLVSTGQQVKYDLVIIQSFPVFRHHIALEKALFFSTKTLIFFLFLDENIHVCFGKSLEVPH